MEWLGRAPESRHRIGLHALSTEKPVDGDVGQLLVPLPVSARAELTIRELLQQSQLIAAIKALHLSRLHASLTNTPLVRHKSSVPAKPAWRRQQLQRPTVRPHLSAATPIHS